tara:strand:+ start:6501 stop:7001 length:501 start_codon:yes stop_codon:yes gene_type:complete
LLINQKKEKGKKPMALEREKGQKEEEKSLKEERKKGVRELPFDWPLNNINRQYYMLPQKNRLKRKKDFETVFKKGEGIKEGFLFLKFLPSKLKGIRFGFVVSEKVSKKAAVRNRVKRQLREIIRPQIPKIDKGVDCVLITRPGIEEENFKDVKEAIDKLFKRARLI